ncbi:MAG TPA: Fe-S cluster assembly protein SufD [Bacteroidia bacterium]|jgi:Fe-S cluster assembly protein SufD|nr:Fe-S cluster assembly protein SufD [Bacteroidia bacterium]
MNTAETIPFKDVLLGHFEELLPSLSGDSKLRREAADYFREKGFPTKKWEDYKYVNPESILRKGLSFRNDKVRGVTENDLKEFTLVPNAATIILVNGKYVSHSKDLPKGVIIKDISDAIVSDDAAKKHYGKYALHSSDPFIALNTAMMNSGAFIHIDKNVKADRPVHIIHIANNEVSSFHQSRVLIVAEPGSEASVIESYESIGPVKTFTNALTEVYVGANAKLDHYRLQNEGEAGQQVNTSNAHVCGDALYNTYTFTLGGNFIRNNLNIVFSGKNGEAHLYGLYPMKNAQIVDNHTVVDHAVPNCMSNELYKGVIDGKASATFNGKIYVRPDAQKTNAFQTNRNILLSDDATINTKPQLEIYADDVKCSHGTSTGKVDEDAMFYLRARGIGEASARALLIRAFAGEVVEKVKIEELKNFIDKRIDEILK